MFVLGYSNRLVFNTANGLECFRGLRDTCKIRLNLMKVGMALVLVLISLNLPDRRFICLNCGYLALFVPSYWFGCLSFTLARFRTIPTFMTID